MLLNYATDDSAVNQQIANRFESKLLGRPCKSLYIAHDQSIVLINGFKKKMYP